MDNQSKPKIFTIPNLLTFIRLLGAIYMLFFTEFPSVEFYVVFIVCGLTDIADGPIARATNTSSTFGARLDSVADLTFYVSMLIKILPFLWANLPHQIFIFVGLIALLRLTVYAFVGIRYRKFAATHTFANKISSASLFFIPLVAPAPLTVFRICCYIVTAFGVLANLEELLIHLLSKEYRTDIKTVFAYLKPKSADQKLKNSHTDTK